MMSVWIDSSRLKYFLYPFSAYLLVTLLHCYQCHRPMTESNYAKSEKMQERKEQNKKEEVIAYLTIAQSQKMLWLCSFYLCLSLQLTYVTADFRDAPPAEPKKPNKAEAVEYTGVQFAHPWGHKVCLQGTHVHFDCRDNHCSKGQLCLLIYQQADDMYLYISPLQMQGCHINHFATNASMCMWTCALKISVILVFLNSSVVDGTPLSNLQNLYRYLKHSLN